MGFFGAYLMVGNRWTELEPGAEFEEPDEPWLYVNIHDSDFTVVMYGPAGPGSGEAYLGCTPRTYFEDDEASPPTDVAIEAEGLAAWWAGYHRGADRAARTVKAQELRPLLAEDDVPAGDEDADDEDLDEADVFVEIKTARFLTALGLTVPDGLSS